MNSVLTATEINDLWNESKNPDDFARAIERAVLAKAVEQEALCEVEHISYDDGKTYASELYFEKGSLDELPDGMKLYAHPAPQQPMPQCWDQLILEEMEDGFMTMVKHGALHDDALLLDDTQSGVEFAIKHFKAMLSASPKV